MGKQMTILQTEHFTIEHAPWQPVWKFSVQPRSGIHYRFTPTLPILSRTVENALRLMNGAEAFYVREQELSDLSKRHQAGDEFLEAAE